MEERLRLELPVDGGAEKLVASRGAWRRIKGFNLHRDSTAQTRRESNPRRLCLFQSEIPSLSPFTTVLSPPATTHLCFTISKPLHSTAPGSDSHLRSRADPRHSPPLLQTLQLPFFVSSIALQSPEKLLLPLSPRSFSPPPEASIRELSPSSPPLSSNPVAKDY